MAEHSSPETDIEGAVSFVDELIGEDCNDKVRALVRKTIRAIRIPAHAPGVVEVSCEVDLLDDIEVDADGKCKWTDVANAQTHIRAVLHRFLPSGEIRAAVIEECARHVEATGLRNPDNIARDIRALSLTRPERDVPCTHPDYSDWDGSQPEPRPLSRPDRAPKK